MVLEIVVSLAFDSLAGVILSELDSVKKQVREIDEKVDAIVFAEMHAAGRALREAAELPAGASRTRLLHTALDRFDLGDARLRLLLEKRRDSVGVYRSADTVYEATVSRDPKRILMRIHRRLNDHSVLERAWIVGRVGAVRAAMELRDTELTRIKARDLAAGAAEVGGFLEFALSNWLSKSAALEAGTLPNSPLKTSLDHLQQASGLEVGLKLWGFVRGRPGLDDELAVETGRFNEFLIELGTLSEWAPS